jgi:hypothetical protein
MAIDPSKPYDPKQVGVSQADQNNNDRLGQMKARQTPSDGKPNSWETTRVNPYTGTSIAPSPSYQPGSIAASPFASNPYEQNKTISLPAAPAATPPRSGLTISPTFQSGNVAPTASAQPATLPSSLKVTPTFQSGNPDQPPLAGSGAAPAVTSLPPTTTLTPNAGISNGLAVPQPTATMKITPLNGLQNGMPLPNSAVNPPAAPADTDWAARFRKETGTNFDPRSKMDILNMNRLKGMAPVGKGEDTTLNRAQYRAGQYSR